MHPRRLRPATRWLLPALVGFVATGPASANYFDLLHRVPDSANTLILIDVERMLMSPVAMKEKWRDTARSAEGQALHFPIDAERYMLASKLNFVSNFENIWDAALIETTGEVSLPYLARKEGGYLDKVEGLEVAYSPRDAFIVQYKPTILGVYFPANKQDLARSVRSVKAFNEPQVSEYLRKGVGLASGDDLMVAAFDLRDLFTSRQVRELLHHCESLAGKRVDLDALTRVLTSVKGVTLTLQATDRLKGKVRVDFGESTAPIRDVAKALMFEALEKNGMMLDPEMKNWAVRHEANAVTLEGRLSTRGLRALTDLIPFPAETLDLKKADASPGRTAPGSAGASSPQDSKAATSKKYFQHISLLVDQLRTDCRAPNTTAKLQRRMVDKAALEIDRLPVLNIDEELVSYGSGVSGTLRNMRNLSKYSSLEALYKQESMVSSGGYGYYGGYSGGGGDILGTTVMRKQQDASLRANELSVFTMLEEKTAEVRKKMTLKYQVEF
jgi:hypothetical protein